MPYPIIAALALTFAGQAQPIDRERALQANIAYLVSLLGPGAQRGVDFGVAPKPSDLAAKELGKIGAPAVPALIQVLRGPGNDPGGWRRALAIEAITDCKDRRGVPDIINILQTDPEDGVREVAADHLGEIGDPTAIPALIEALSYKGGFMEGAIAARAARALKGFRDPVAIPKLVPLLDHIIIHGGPVSFPERAEEAMNTLEDCGPPAVGPIVQSLKTAGEYGQENGARLLGRLKARAAVPALAELLGQSKHTHVQIAAAEALGAIGDNAGVKPLLAALKGENATVRRAAAEALGSFPTDEVIGTLEKLAQAGKEGAAGAVKALGRIATPEALQAVAAAVGAGDEDVHRAAAEGLGMGRNKDAVPILLEILSKDEYFTKVIAAEALGDIGDPSAVDALIEVTKNKDGYTRGHGIRALAKIGTPKALAALGDSLRGLNAGSLDAYNALRNMNGEDVVDQLIRGLGGGSVGVGLAAELLGKLKATRATKALLEALSHEPSYCAEALGEIGAQEAIGPLKDLLNDSGAGVREAAATALGKLRAKAAVSRLTDHLTDKDVNVRTAAAEALGRIGDPAVISALERLMLDPKQIGPPRAAYQAIVAIESR